MSNEMTKAERQWAAADEEYRAFKEERQDWISRKYKELEAEADRIYGDRIQRFKKKRDTLWQQVEAERVAKAESNPLVGRRVIVSARKGHFSHGGKPERHGILEVCKPETEIPSNLNYGRPIIGSIFVRILKSDGTPSKRVEIYNKHEWKLVEENPCQQ